ncbi:MAG: molecular chaperone DnaJ [bacterium]
MAEKHDYYELLGVSRNASAEEIKKNYRRLARQHHPDVNNNDPQSEERFKEVGEAYEVLSNPQKRAMYDQYGHDGPRQGNFGGGGADFGFSGGINDIFDSFFGNMGGQSRPDPTGESLRYDLEITLEEAARGTEKNIRVPHQTTCTTCHGSGSAGGGSAIKCPACSGLGQRRQTVSGIFGMQVQTQVPCDRCGATGEIIPNPCKECSGTGRVRISESITVTVPPGVDTGSRIRHRGKGNAGMRGAQSGDLMVQLFVKEDKVFQRSGNDIARRFDIPFTTAALGGNIHVKTLIDGDVEYGIPSGTQPGQTFRIKGKGMPDLHNSNLRGDLHFIVGIAVPTSLSHRERELLEELAKESGDTDAGKKDSIFSKAKKKVEEIVDDISDFAKGN